MSQDMRARYLNERVMTATPGQRIVMLYDRLALDLARAQAAATGQSPTAPAAPAGAAPVAGSAAIPQQPKAQLPQAQLPQPAIQAHQQNHTPTPGPQQAILDAAPHIDHALQIIGNLAGSLQATDETRDLTDNLGSLYGYLLRELTAARSGELSKLESATTIIGDLRDTWREAVAQTASEKAAPGVRVG